MSDTARAATHETLVRHDAVKGSSDRSFGFVFTGFFLIVGLWPALFGNGFRWWALAVSGVLLIASLVSPAILAPANRLWMKFGLLLHKIVNPIVMGLIFFLTVTPIGLIMRAMGKDPLRLKLDPAVATYWIDRTPPGPPPDSMTQQF